MNSAAYFEPEFVQFLHAMAWFSRCGQSLPADLAASLPFEVAPVATLKKPCANGAPRNGKTPRWRRAMN